MAGKYNYPTEDELTLKLLEHFESAQGTPAEDDGAAWYAVARRECRRMARAHDVTLATAAGVVAALSPRVQWSTNLKLADQTLAQRGTDAPAPRGAMLANYRKADRIANGERPLDVLGGPKVRAFYRALMGDANACVVDTWMLQAVEWPAPNLNAKGYAAISAALVNAARLANLPVSELQAIVWTQVRGDAR